MSDVIDRVAIQVDSEATSVTDGLNELITALNNLKNTAKEATDALQKIKGALNNGLANTKHVKSVDKLKTSLDKIARFSSKNMFGGIKKAFDGIGKSVDWLNGHLSLSNTRIGGLLGQMMRVAKMRILRTIVKEIGAAFKTGLEDLALASSEVNANLTKLTSVAAQFKNALGSATYSAIEPWIDELVALGNAAVKAFNYLSMLFSYISGKTTYKEALPITEKFAEATDKSAKNTKKATDAAKKYKQELMGFDEINSLSPETPDSSSSGGGSGSGSTKKTPDYKAMFKESPIDPWLQDMVDRWDFTDAGKRLADKINSMLGSINWDSIRRKASELASDISTAINGFAANIDGKLIGKSIGEAINIGIDWIIDFWGQIQWWRLGKQAHDSLIATFETINADSLGAALIARVRAALEFLVNFLPQSWEEWGLVTGKIAEALSSAIQNFPSEELGTVIGQLIQAALSAVKSLADNDVLQHIAEEIKKVIVSAIDWLKTHPTEAKEAIENALSDLWEALKILFTPDIEIGGIHWSAGGLFTAGVAAFGFLGFIKKVFGTVFKSLTFKGGGVGGITMLAGIGCLLEGTLQGINLIKTVSSGGTVSLDQWTSAIKSILMGAGLLIFNVNPVAGLVTIGIGLAIEPILNRVLDIVEDIKENGITTGGVSKVLNMLGDMIGIPGLHYVGIKNGNPIYSVGIRVDPDVIPMPLDDNWGERSGGLGRYESRAHNITKLKEAVSQFSDSMMEAGNSGSAAWQKYMQTTEATLQRAKRAVGSYTDYLLRQTIQKYTMNLEVTISLSAKAKRFANEIISSAAVSSNVKNFASNLINFSQFAGGGFPKAGSLYLADENGVGSELVGQIGNRHAVANNEQIGDAIFRYMDAHDAQSGGGVSPDALANAVVRALRSAGVGAVYLDGKMLSQSINRESRRIGRPAVTF